MALVSRFRSMLMAVSSARYRHDARVSERLQPFTDRVPVQRRVRVDRDKDVRVPVGCERDGLGVLLARVALPDPGESHRRQPLTEPEVPYRGVVDRGAVVDHLDVVRQPGLAEQRDDRPVQYPRILVVARDHDGHVELIEPCLLPGCHGRRLLRPRENELKHDERKRDRPRSEQRRVGDDAPLGACVV